VFLALVPIERVGLMRTMSPGFCTVTLSQTPGWDDKTAMHGRQRGVNVRLG
jgi:hypothetical protein